MNYINNSATCFYFSINNTLNFFPQKIHGYFFFFWFFSIYKVLRYLDQDHFKGHVF